jgi:hypothetical protein
MSRDRDISYISVGQAEAGGRDISYISYISTPSPLAYESEGQGLNVPPRNYMQSFALRVVGNCMILDLRSFWSRCSSSASSRINFMRKSSKLILSAAARFQASLANFWGK